MVTSSNRNSYLCLIPLSQFVQSQFALFYLMSICTVISCVKKGLYTIYRPAVRFIYYIYNK